MPPARELLSNVDFYDINYDLPCDDLLNFMIYANESYKYSDFYYSHIPIEKRNKLLEKFSDCSLDNEQEKVVIKLIETTSYNDLKQMFNFMKDKDIYSKLCSRIDNLGGDDNYAALIKVVFKKWRKCYGDVSFDLLENNYFFKKGVIYFSLAKGGVIGMNEVGAKAQTSCGFGFDSHHNFIFFTGTAYYAFAGDHFAGNISNLNSFIFGLSYSLAEFSIMIDWAMADVRGLIGQQDACSPVSGLGDVVENIAGLKAGAGGKIPSLSLDFDANDHSFQGAGVSLGLGVGVAVDKSQIVNTGIIVSGGELGSLLNSFSELPNYEPFLIGIPSPYFPKIQSFVDLDNILKFSVDDGVKIIDTGIPAKEVQTKDGSLYIISLTAEANY